MSRRTYRLLIVGCVLVCLLQARQAGRILVQGLRGPYGGSTLAAVQAPESGERLAGSDAAGRVPKDARRPEANLARR